MSQKPISCLTTPTEGLATGRGVPVTLQGVYSGSWYSYSLRSLEADPEEVKKIQQKQISTETKKKRGTLKTTKESLEEHLEKCTDLRNALPST